MATTRWQSQFLRPLSALLLGGLIALVLAAPTVRADSGSLQAVPPSGYNPVQGEPFFLLSDGTWSSEEDARIRIEVPGSAQAGEVERYGGVDLVIYRVPRPLEFLQHQRNLHRPSVKARHSGEGLANTLTQLWDRWYKESRRVWQRVLADGLRASAVEQQPQLGYGRRIGEPPQFERPTAFAPLEGFELVDRFRYPVMHAKPIQPPAGVTLPGSSSEFAPVSPGNIMVPLGRLRPGLYLVEGIVGAHRAHTLVFVSNTQAITKISGKEMLVWTSDRRSGRAVPGATLRWSDGVGLMASAATDGDGIARLAHDSPERSYLIGSDREGGVFVSENFYYDSEIYNTKLYAFTDRPLYRPGDEVMLKVLGREFRDARTSSAARDGVLRLQVFDPAGTALFATQLAFTGAEGAQTRFRLPDNAPAGGYDLRYDYQGDSYGAAFRVADYIKPHFDIELAMAKPELRTGEPIAGRIRLTYPDGKPVAGARLTLAVRAQKITLVDGEMQYANAFPVSLEQQELQTDAQGLAELRLPAASEPSRYMVSVLASDGAAYRVKVTREFLVERGVNPWKLQARTHFSRPGEALEFALSALGQGGQPPARWEAQRLESRESFGGELAAGAERLRVEFAQSGSYMLSLRDAAGNLLGATSHWVAGDGLQAAPGSVEIVLDRDHYRAGEVAEALITFPEPVDEALLTLERDRVEQHALLSRTGRWLKLERIAARQWRARIPVGENFSPNLTFSVLYTRGHDFIFANAGLVVEQPALELDIRPERERYRPGETVNIDITSRFGGQPAPALLSVGVVDEMVYVLQPEIAPPITEFFYHLRRNNVRTTASHHFISYDMARSYSRAAPPAHGTPERSVKVLERPRRDEVDTAAWAPSLATGADGRTRLSFVMPDSLTRWRITVRALDREGHVGQKTRHLLSDKPAYVKWTGPRRFRAGDQPIADLVVFNRGEQPADAELAINGAGLNAKRALRLTPGANFVALPLEGFQSGEVQAELRIGGETADRLATRLERAPDGWTAPLQQIVPLAGPATPLALPADARGLELRFAGSAAEHFLKVADDLIDYPWGCVEQTASRLIPLALAYQSLPREGSEALHAQPLGQLLQSQRQRLVALAGPGASFGWWGHGSQESAFLSGYAYFADWYASRSLGLELPETHWRELLDIYAGRAAAEPVLQRALMLWWMQHMGLPVDTLLKGVERALDGTVVRGAAPGEQDSLLMAAADSAVGLQAAEVLVQLVRRELGQPERPALGAAVAGLRAFDSPFTGALLHLAGRAPEGSDAATLLARSSARQPTLERAMTLVWLQQALGGAPSSSGALQPQGWQAIVSRSGQPAWRWPEGAALPTVLQLAAPPAAGAPPVALLRYETFAAETSRLPLRIQRRLYRLVAEGEALQFRAEPVAAGAALRSDALYVDEIELTPQGGARLRFGLLEVPLPPGADVEATTWGLQIKGLKGDPGFAPLRRAVYQSGGLGYASPVETLAEPLRLRQLVRFGARGHFALPPARFHRMYQPSDKAFEAGGDPAWRLRVE